ncbi:hypothetical protein GCM10028801_31710 [Nocardioides maradonensis]
MRGFADDRLGYFLPHDTDNPRPGHWCTVYSERGSREVRAVLDSEDDLQWLLARSMLQSAATSWELHHRVPHRDSRRGWFAKMAEWTSAYWPQWSAQLAAEQEAILAIAPFDDDNTVFVEFLGVLTQSQKRAVWALRDELADRFRAAVLEGFRATGELPDLHQVEAASGLTLGS